MKVIIIGDVIGKAGREHLLRVLPKLKRERKADLCLVNGENSGEYNGISEHSASILFQAGADIITTGNHVYRRSDAYQYLDDEPYLIRPANYHRDNPGKGYCLYDMGRRTVCVINLAGRLFMDPCDNPFETADRILKEVKTPFVLVDFHAEATSEKRAMGFYLDGRVSCVYGTHTHVQTADEQILPKGTGYITDAGMTGPENTVIGVDPEIAVTKFRTGMPARFVFSQNPCSVEGIEVEIDDNTGKTTKISRINLK